MELKLPEWASVVPSGFPGAIEPPTGKKQEGWDNGEEPPAAYFNWAFQALADTQQEIAAAITGTGGALSSDLSQLLGAMQRMHSKSVLTSLRLVGDTGTSQLMKAVARSHLVIIAVGENAAIARAAQASTHQFLPDTPVPLYAGNFTDVVYDAVNAKFIACGSASAIHTSPGDGVWTARTSPGGISHRALATGAGNSVAVGDSENIWSAANATSWASRTSPFSGAPNITDVAYGAGVFACITSDGRIAYSNAAGTVWTMSNVATVLSTVDPARIEYHASLGFIAHHGTDVWRSADGITWVKIHDAVGLSSTNTPGLLVLPSLWLVAYSDSYGTSAECRYSVTAIDAAVDAYANFVHSAALSWWRVVDGQLYALLGDNLYVGGLV
jgi:hypothetical protein